MARYRSEDDAAADGLRIVHEPDRSQFTVTSGGTDTEDGTPVGEAHYTLRDDPSGGGSIDYDHTYIDPAFRGTGLSRLLAHRAVTDDIASGRRMLASCWFIAGYLGRHPELRH